MAGDSPSRLAKKLGIREKSKVVVTGAPAGYRESLEPLPPSVQFACEADVSTDMAHIFATERNELSRALAALREVLSPEAVVWVSWPKKASGVASEISEGTVRGLALPLGFVDVKVCSVDETWSGLKLVVRKELR